MGLRLPCLWVMLITVPLAALNTIPTGLHKLQVVDLHAKAANTTQNPFDVLGVERDSSPGVAAAAYKRRMSALKDQRCDAKCKEEKEDLKRAYDFASGATFREYKLEKERKEKKERKKKDKQTHRRRDPAKAKEREARSDAWSDWSSYKQYEWELLVDVLKDSLESLVNVTVEEEGDDGGFDYTYNDEL